MRNLMVGLVFALPLGCRSVGSSPAVQPPVSRQAPSVEPERARELLCSDLGDDACLGACPEALGAARQVECLLGFRFGSDPDALALALALYREKGTLAGVDARASIESFHGREEPLFPALPLGSQRYHLAWIRSSLESFDALLGAVAARAAKPVFFEPRPTGVVFFRTAAPAYPSQYSLDDIIGYNLVGPLQADPRDMRETLFHELFHLNDSRDDLWSERVLRSLFDSLVARCSGDHDCLTPFAPHDTVVPDGTYYAFDEASGNVREYAAEVAVRYLVESESALSGEERARWGSPFKCRTEENRTAWSLIVAEFFGDVDLTADCPGRAGGG